MMKALAVTAFFLIQGVSGCDVTSQDIETWKGTQKGPMKLRNAVANTSLEQNLRIEAAFALLAIGEQGPLLKQLRELEEEDRRALAKPFADQLAARLQSDKGSFDDRILAKDMLFSLRREMDASQLQNIDRILVAWVLDDLGRRSAGQHSSTKVVIAAKDTAVPFLLERLTTHRDQLTVLADLLGRVVEGQRREDVAKRIVALIDKKKVISSNDFEALSKVSSETTRRYLLKRAQRGSDAQRILALQALSEMPAESLLFSVSSMAQNPKVALSVRGAAFQVLETIKSPKTLQLLGKVIGAEGDAKVRYRAAEAIITCCGTSGAAKLLQSLPPRYTYAKQDVEDFIEADVKRLGDRVLPALRRSLSSPSWIARVVAIRLIGELGTKSDVPAIEKLKNDKTRLKGWGVTATVGSEAREAMKRLRERS